MKKLLFTLCVAVIFSGNLLSQLPNNNPDLDSLNIYLNEHIKDTDPGMAIIIAQNCQTIFESYRGMACINKNEPLCQTHTMGIASMSKQFEGMAILTLVEEGKCALTDPIGKHLKNLPDESKELTIKQLLTHTSGLPELTQNESFMSHIDKPSTVDEIIKVAFTKPMRHKPGEQYMYCNTGYTIIVKLIEELSGINYKNYLDQHFFKPLKMEHTYSCDYNQDAKNIASRYMQDDNGFNEADKMHFSNLIGGGGIISNARDMKIWADALLTGNRLPKNYKEMWNPAIVNNGRNTEYGLGMGISSIEGETFYYHPGQGSGMNAINLIFPEKNISITVIRNVSKPKTSSPEIALYAFSLLNKK